MVRNRANQSSDNQSLADLKFSEAHFRALSEASFEAIFLSDKGLCLHQNMTAAMMFGYSNTEAIGRLGTEWIAPEDREMVLNNMRSGREALYRATALRKDGTTFPVEIQARMMQTAEGGLFLVTALRDISRQVEAENRKVALEKQLQHSQKLEYLGVLAGGIAHDFNNILMIIRGNSDLALSEVEKNGAVTRYLQTIRRATERAADLSQQMLTYAGSNNFTIKPVNMQKSVEEILNLLDVAIAKKIVFKTNFQRDLPDFPGDSTQIQQVIVNLISNASEAIGDELGEIVVSTGVTHCDEDFLNSDDIVATSANQSAPPAVGNFVFLEVEDTGCGMNENVLPRIFDPFFTTKFTGRGLGMAAVSGIIRSHHGLIRINSQVNVGTTISVFFPLVNSLATTPPPAHHGHDGSRILPANSTILVVDDEPDLRVLAIQLCSRLGFRTLAAIDGQDAVDIYTKHRGEISCVLMDLSMPRLDGIQAIDRITQIDPEARVILCSGYTEQNAARGAKKLKYGTFLCKPYNLEDLEEALQHVLIPN